MIATHYSCTIRGKAFCILLLLCLSSIAAPAQRSVGFGLPYDDPNVRREVYSLEQLKPLVSEYDQFISTRIATLKGEDITKIFGPKREQRKLMELADPTNTVAPLFAPFSLTFSGLLNIEDHSRRDLYAVGDLGYVEFIYGLNGELRTPVLYLHLDEKFVPLRSTNDLHARLEWDKERFAAIKKWLEKIDGHAPLANERRWGFYTSNTNTLETLIRTYHLEDKNPPNEARAAVARDFPKFTSVEKFAVLTELWPRVRCAEFSEVLWPLMRWPKTPEHDNDVTFLDKVLVCLLDLQPERVRSLIQEDLSQSRPVLSLHVLLALPDKVIPEWDGIFLGHLNSESDGFKIAPAIERYGSDRIRPQLIAFYLEHEGRWACSIQTALLRYWLKHDRAAALQAIERAATLREDTGCFRDVLVETLHDQLDASAEVLVLKFAGDKDREVATGALSLLARYGSAIAKDAVIERWARIPQDDVQSEWPPDARLHILRALGRAKDWKPSVEQQQRVARLLSDIEKERLHELRRMLPADYGAW